MCSLMNSYKLNILLDPDQEIRLHQNPRTLPGIVPVTAPSLRRTIILIFNSINFTCFCLYYANGIAQHIHFYICLFSFNLVFEG